jgi:HEPN domain-containing protein
MPYVGWLTRVERELRLAKKSRAEGNEGRARVCARRAAGLVVAEYLRRRGELSPERTALGRLKALRNRPEVSPRARWVAEHMTATVTMDNELPVDADLIAEARRLAQELLGVSPKVD